MYSIIAFMKPNRFSSNQSLLVEASSLWLDVCVWLASPGFPSLAVDHTAERIDLNKLLIRIKAGTYVYRVKDDSMTGVAIYMGDAL